MGLTYDALESPKKMRFSHQADCAWTSKTCDLSWRTQLNHESTLVTRFGYVELTTKTGDTKYHRVLDHVTVNIEPTKMFLWNGCWYTRKYPTIFCMYTIYIWHYRTIFLIPYYILYHDLEQTVKLVHAKKTLCSPMTSSEGEFQLALFFEWMSDRVNWGMVLSLAVPQYVIFWIYSILHFLHYVVLLFKIKTIYIYVYVYLRFYYYPNLRFEFAYNIYRPFRSMALRRPQHLYHVGLGREPRDPGCRWISFTAAVTPVFMFWDITLGYYMILPSIWGYDYGYNYGDITIILLCYHP